MKICGRFCTFEFVEVRVCSAVCQTPDSFRFDRFAWTSDSETLKRVGTDMGRPFPAKRGSYVRLRGSHSCRGSHVRQHSGYTATT